MQPARGLSRSIGCSPFIAQFVYTCKCLSGRMVQRGGEEVGVCVCERGGSTQGTGSEGGIVFYAEPAPKASEREEEEELTARDDIRGRASPCPRPQSRSRVCKVQLDCDGERAVGDRTGMSARRREFLLVGHTHRTRRHTGDQHRGQCGCPQ